MFEKEKCEENLNTCIEYIKDVLIEEFPTNEITLHYLVLALLKNVEVSNKLSTCLTTTSLAAMETSLIKYASDHSISTIKPGRDIPFSKEFDEFYEKVEKERQQRSGDKISCDDVILAILKDDGQDNRIGKVFRRAGLTYSMYTEKIKEKPKEYVSNIDTGSPLGGFTDRKLIIQLGPDDDPQDVMQAISNAGIGVPGNKKLPKTKHPNIDAYCTNLNDLVDLGKLDKIVGRENETDEIIRILGRRKKNNAIIVGPDGCGITVICENLATKIKQKNVPDFLLDKEVISLDMTALIAGTTLRGMFEERVKGVLGEIKASGKYILFIDNIGSVLNDKGKNDYDISAMLSNSLENGELQVIGTADFKSYRTTFDKNPSLSRRFQKIIIDAPSKEDSIEILKGIKTYYEDFHKVKFDDNTIELCVELAARYIPERNLPDSAIDIMDEAGAVISINNKQNSEIKEIKEEINNLKQEIDKAKKEENYSKVDELEKQIRTKKFILSSKEKRLKEKHPENYTPISEDLILELVSKKTNIPINNLSVDDKKKLASINDRLKSEVIGQDEAVDTICRTLKRNRIGLSSNKCLCSYMMIGKTGCGKCISGETFITIRNKKNGVIQKLSINDFKKIIENNPD